MVLQVPNSIISLTVVVLCVHIYIYMCIAPQKCSDSILLYYLSTWLNTKNKSIISTAAGAGKIAAPGDGVENSDGWAGWRWKKGRWKLTGEVEVSLLDEVWVFFGCWNNSLSFSKYVLLYFWDCFCFLVAQFVKHFSLIWKMYMFEWSSYWEVAWNEISRTCWMCKCPAISRWKKMLMLRWVQAMAAKIPS